MSEKDDWREKLEATPEETSVDVQKALESVKSTALSRYRRKAVIVGTIALVVVAVLAYILGSVTGSSTTTSTPTDTESESAPSSSSVSQPSQIAFFDDDFGVLGLTVAS